MGQGPDPAGAGSPAEFMHMMRQLRRWADLSFRQLERNATDAGDVLPRATIAGALGRDELPREELLAAYVRACGADDDTVSAWIDARRRLSLAGGATPPTPVSDNGVLRTAADKDDDDTPDDTPQDSPPGRNEAADEAHSPDTGPSDGPTSGPADAITSPPSPASNWRRQGPLVAIAACTVAGILTLALWPSDDPDSLTDGAPRRTPPSAQSEQPVSSPTTSRSATAEPSKSPAASPVEHERTTPKPNPSPTSTPPPAPAPALMPAAGWTRIHPVSAPSLCLTEGRERNQRTDREIAVQHSCADAPLPRVYLEKLDERVYRIQWHHPDPAKGVGCLAVDGASPSSGALLSPGDCADSDSQKFRLEASSGGFRLRPLHSGLCIGFLPPVTDGAEAMQTGCTGTAGQAFAFTAGQ